MIKYADAVIKGDERAARAARGELEEVLPPLAREAVYKYPLRAALTDDSRELLIRILKAVIQPDVVAERHRIALEAILAGMALRLRLLADLLEGRRGGREIIVEALNALSRAVERAGGGVMPLRERVIDAAKAGDERRLSALARWIVEATPPSLRHLLHGLVEELKAGRTPEEAVEALRPRLAEFAREAAEAAKSITAAEIRREALERAERLAKGVERAVAVPGEKPGFRKLVLDGAEIGRIVEEKIKKKHADTRLAIKARDPRVELELEKKLLKAVRSEELRKLGEGLGHKAFKAAVLAQYFENAGVMEGVFASALALEKYLKAELGERAEEVVEGMWGEIGRLWEDGVVHGTAFKFLRKYGTSELKELLAEIEERVEEIKKEAKARGKNVKDPYSRLPRELRRALVEAFLDRAPEVLGALREGLWALQEIDEGAREAKELPELGEYVERLEEIAAILEAAARELTKRAEGEKRYGLVEIKGKLYPAYEGPAKLSARVEHVEKDGKKYAVIEVKYGDRTEEG